MRLLSFTFETYLDSPLQMSMPIKNFTFTEAQQQIQKLNIKGAPDFELINNKMLSELPKEGIKFLVLLYNAVLRLKYWPLQLKVGQIILVLKLGKTPHEEIIGNRLIEIYIRIVKLRLRSVSISCCFKSKVVVL